MSYNYFDGKVKKMEITEELKAAKAEITGGIDIAGDLDVSGNLDVGGDLTADSVDVAGGINFSALFTELDDPPVNAEASVLEKTFAASKLTFAAVVAGEAGDDITIELVDPGEDEEDAEIVDVTGTDIVVTLRNVSGTLSTAAQVKAAIDGDDDAKELITVTINTAGVVEAMTATPLAGGVDGTVAPSAGIWGVDGDYLYITMGKNTVADANWKRIELDDLEI